MNIKKQKQVINADKKQKQTNIKAHKAYLQT